MDDLRALELRVKRERAARLEAESLLEAKSKKLHESVEKSRGLARPLKETVKLQTRELLSAQRVTKLGTFVWEIHNDLFSWTEGGLDVLAMQQDSNQTTFSPAISLAFSSFARMMQAAPSALAQQSYTQKGEATGSEAIAFSMVISFWKRALGFLAP